MRKFSILLLLLAGCTGPKIVPDDVLVEIFRDVYLTNAVAEQRLSMNLDSLSIYEPLFARRGYTGEDIQYTIGNFAKRKSASISQDIVGRAMDLLHAEGRTYTLGIAARDSVTRMARERFRQRVLTRDEIRVRRVADTGRLRIVIPAAVGSYRVEFGYLVDSMDENQSILRTNVALVDSRGRNLNSNSYRLGRAGHGHASMEVTADTAVWRLIVDLNPYNPRTIKRPWLTIDSLRVTHYLPGEVAFDSIQREWFNYFARSFQQ